MHQVALLARGEYTRHAAVSCITVDLPHGRRQRIYGREEVHGSETAGLLYTEVGELSDAVNMRTLLETNANLRYSRIAVDLQGVVVLLAWFDLDHTSVRDCAPMLQEIAAVADDLEARFFMRDLA